jgi:hypothetical protein
MTSGNCPDGTLEAETTKDFFTGSKLIASAVIYWSVATYET